MNHTIQSSKSSQSLRLTGDFPLGSFIEAVQTATGVPVCHAPASHAGEKTVYRYAAGECDGTYESVYVTLKFISRSLTGAYGMLDRVSALCTVGDFWGEDGVKIARVGGEGSSFIGRTGHFAVTARFKLTRRTK